MSQLDREQIADWLQLLEHPAPQAGETDEALRQRVAGALRTTAAAVLKNDVSDRVRNTTRDNRRRLERAASELNNVAAPGYGVVDVEVAEVKRLVNLMLQGMSGAGA